MQSFLKSDEGTKKPLVSAPDDFEFHSQPGHLVRRLHQIATSLFLDLSKTLNVTPVQYAALNAIARHPGFEQRQIARLIAIDRTTINVVTRKLEERGWVHRRPVGRAVNLDLTAEGERALGDVDRLTARHSELLLAPLGRGDRAIFLRLLEQLVDENNVHSRVPVNKSEVRIEDR